MEKKKKKKAEVLLLSVSTVWTDLSLNCPNTKKYEEAEV